MKINYDKIIPLICIVILVIFLSPYFFFSERSLFLVHDNLNSNVVWYNSIAKSKYLFESTFTTVPFIFNGIPRGCYPSELNIYILLYYFFEALTAYCINGIVIHLVAFLGTYIFLKDYLLTNATKKIQFPLALCFACLPFWPSGQLCIAGMPLLLWCFLNILYGKKLKVSWIIIMLFPFYSSIVFSNVFFVVFFGLIYFILFLFKKLPWNKNVVIAFVVFSCISLLVEYRLIILSLNDFVSQRNIYATSEPGHMSLRGWVKTSFIHYLKGQYHYYSFHLFIIFFSFCAFFITNHKNRKIIFILNMIMLFISMIFVLPDCGILYKYIQIFTSKNVLQLRFISLFPLLSILLFSITIKAFIELGKYRIVYMCLLFQLSNVIFLFLPGDYLGSIFIENSFYNTLVKSETDVNTFDQYYKTKIFKKIKRKVPPGGFNVLTLGINPQVAQFNGYNTIDGYYYYYPFEKVKMISEIVKPYSILRNKVDFTASNASIDNLITPFLKRNIGIDLPLDFKLLKKNNCRYIFSGFKLRAKEINLEAEISYKEAIMLIYSIK